MGDTICHGAEQSLLLQQLQRPDPLHRLQSGGKGWVVGVVRWCPRHGVALSAQHERFGVTCTGRWTLPQAVMQTLPVGGGLESYSLNADPQILVSRPCYEYHRSAGLRCPERPLKIF